MSHSDALAKVLEAEVGQPRSQRQQRAPQPDLRREFISILWTTRAVCHVTQDNGTVVAENRPYMSTKDLNWADHACHSYEHATYNITHVSAPDFLTGLAPQR